jgi:predicted transcriptional regulator
MSEAEKEIMDIIWASGGPVTSSQVLDRLPAERDLKPTTVLTFLTRLTEKGLLSTTKRGKKNLYTPLVTRDEYKRFESRDFLANMHGGSIKSFVAALVEGEDISEEELDDLRRWLREK